VRAQTQLIIVIIIIIITVAAFGDFDVAILLLLLLLLLPPRLLLLLLVLKLLLLLLLLHALSEKFEKQVLVSHVCAPVSLTLHIMINCIRCLKFGMCEVRLLRWFELWFPNVWIGA
jgi:hypothetical protein